MQWRLIFSGMLSWTWVATVVVCILAATVLCLYLMRLERRLVSGRVGWMLMLLRTGILAWLLLIMLRPVLTSEWDESQVGRVVVAIDASQSMETADRHAGADEKIRWAIALGMLGDNLTEAEIRQLALAIDGHAPPVDGDAENGEPAVADPPAAVGGLRLRQIEEVIDEFNLMSRQEFIRRLLTAPSQHVLADLRDVAAVDLRLFALDQQSIDESGIPGSIGRPLDAAGPQAAVGPQATDAVRLLSDLTSEQDGNRIRGVVLLSDGRQTEPGDLAAEGRRLGTLEIPVYTIPVGSRLKPRDISIASIEAPEAVFVNDSAMISAVLGTPGFEGTPVVVKLERDGQTVETQTVTPASASTRVAFTAPTEETGRFDYRICVDEQVGELRSDNNSRNMSFRVVDNKGRVLLVDGDARWELRYLKNLFERDKQIELATVVFRQPWLQLLNSTFIDRSLPSDDAFREQLAQTDLLIVGDVTPEQFTDTHWRLIEDAVSREGLTLIMIPGRRAFIGFNRSEALNNLVPVEEPVSRIAEQFQRSQGDGTQSTFQLLTSDEAASMPMFQFADLARPDDTIRTLPGHPWACTGRPKASANVWAWALSPVNQTDREAVIVHQYYGFGQVVWMGIDSTWRWRQRRGDSLHHKFWGQLVRWAARNRTASGNEQVRLTLSDVVVEEQQSVDVVARFSPRGLLEIGDGQVEVLVTPAEPDSEGTQTEPLRAQLKPVADSPERFSGHVPPLPPGTWTVSLHVSTADNLADNVNSELVVQPRKAPELADVSCHRGALQQLSNLSGGQLIEPWNVGQLAELLRPEDTVEPRIVERTLWDHWTALVVFFALMMTEWVTRKLNGLP